MFDDGDANTSNSGSADSRLHRFLT